MSKRQKLLLVAPHFPPQPGGLEYFALNICKQLGANHQWDIVVVTSAPKGQPYHLETMGALKIHRLPYQMRLSNSPLSLRWFGTMRRIIKSEQPDVINVHTPVPGLADITAAVCGKIPLVVNYHSGPMRKDKPLLDTVISIYEKLFLPLLLHRAQRIICSSDYVRNSIAAAYADKSLTISPGVDADLFHPSSKKTTEPRLLFIGSLNTSDTYKGLSHLLDACAQLQADYPKLHLAVIGQGDNLANYQAQCNDLGISHMVNFTGRVENHLLPGLLPTATMLVHPSLNDSFPMVITEAMAAGLPVVSTTAGGIPTLVDDGLTGILVAPGSTDQLTAAIKQLLDNPALARKYGAAGRAKILRELTWERQAARTNDVLHQATHPRIVQLAAYYPPHVGGLERVAAEVSWQLAQTGYPVSIITSNVGAKQEPPCQKQPNLTINRLKTFEFAHTAFMPGLLLKLWRVPKPTIFHLHLAQAFVPEVMWLVAKLRRVPYIVHFHLDVEPSGPLGVLFIAYKKIVQPVIMRSADYVITLSPEQKTLIEQQYDKEPTRVIYMPNGVSDEFLEIGKNRDGAGKRLNLLFVGRLAKQKRVDRLLQAVALCKADVTVNLVGDGEDRQELEQLAKELKLKNVTFHGNLPHGEQIKDMYRSADVFILTSDKEGMSLAMLEAMAAALPIIGSDVPGLAEHIKDIGYVVHDPSPSTFAAAIDAVAGNPKLLKQMSHDSYQLAETYSWSKLVKTLATTYDTMQDKITRAGQGTRPTIAVGSLLAAWFLFCDMSLMQKGIPGLVLDVFGFAVLVGVPALLIGIICRLRKPRLEEAGYLLGGSLLFLISTVLISNTILPLVSVVRPLDLHPLLGSLTLGVLVLAALAWRKKSPAVRPPKWKVPNGLSVVMAAVGPLLILLSVMGALYLNNGGNSAFTLTMLAGALCYMIALFGLRNRLHPAVIPWAIYCLALSLLLMTSLRGWYTTGHDIQREFRVMELAKNNGVWQVQRFRDAYNACLSITILPTIFANTLKQPDPYVYKVYFQLLFATVPVFIYVLAKRFATAMIGLIAAIYFMAFPTFFTDMPMLARQEMAFIFFILMLIALFDTHLRVGTRRTIFTVLGFGLIFSHYSTTYSVIIIIGVSYGCLWALRRLGQNRAKFRQLRKTAMAGVLDQSYKPILTLGMLATLAAASFFWTGILTQTGKSTTAVIAQTLRQVITNSKEDTKSGDTNYSLLAWQKKDPQKEINSYAKNIVGQARADAPADTYIQKEAFAQFKPKIIQSTDMPLTPLGKLLQKTHLNTATFNQFHRQGYAKLLQLLMLVGFVYVIVRKRGLRVISPEYLTLAGGCILFVGLQVILPTLSVEYGLLRAFQQSLVVMGLFIVVGSLVMVSRKKSLVASGVAAVVVIGFFVSSSGLATQLLGGYLPQLNLNNNGTYYDNYYLHKSEITAVDWLNAQVVDKNGEVQTEVQTDRYLNRKIQAYSEVNTLDDIYPGLLRPGTYVFTGYSNVVLSTSTFSYQGDLLTYKYPMQALDKEKDQIYSNGTARIYR